MKILFVNRLLGIFWGGGETFDYNIAKCFQSIGNNVSILTGKKIFVKPKNIIRDLDIYYIATPYLREYSYKFEYINNKLSSAFMILDKFLFEIAAYNWIKKNHRNFDIIQILSMVNLAEKTIKNLKVPVVLRLPGPPSRRRDIPIIKSLINKFSNIAIIASGDTIGYLMKYGIHKVHNVPPGVYGDLFIEENKHIRSYYNIPSDYLVILSCARLIPCKGFDFLLRGFKKALSLYPSMILMIVGDGPGKRSIQKKISKLGIKSNVIMMGQVEHQEVLKIYKSCDIFVLTSSYESFSIATLEAKASGLPVILTAVGALPLQVKNGLNGFLVNYGDEKALAEKILMLARDFELRKKMGAFNRQEVITNYSWNKSAKVLMSIYNSLLKSA